MREVAAEAPHLSRIAESSMFLVSCQVYSTLWVAPLWVLKMVGNFPT
nr:MAG TPA: hypothetical protein [Caudoviricetes sp.]